jgi:hypothetical protein
MASFAQRIRKEILRIEGVMAGDSVFDVGHEAFFEVPRSGSDWMSVRFQSIRDIPFIVALVALAAAQHLPASGRPLRSPPTGSDLERRRRWH